MYQQNKFDLPFCGLSMRLFQQEKALNMNIVEKQVKLNLLMMNKKKL